MTDTKPLAPEPAQAIALAEWLEGLGWKPTPLHTTGPDGRTCTCKKGGNCGGSAGKHNIAAGWQQDLRGAEIFREMAPRRRRMNVGILTGEPSGIFVLDIDPKDGGFESMTALCTEHGALPDTFVVQTGSGGWHYYFQMPPFDVRNNAGKIAPGVDIRGNGGMVVGPGSVSHAGEYRVLQAVAPAPAPQWLLELVKPTMAETVDVAEQFGAALEAHSAAEPTQPLNATPAASGEPGAHARYEASIIRGELARVHELKTAGWSKPWDVTTFEVACNLIELANADWAALTPESAHDQFVRACPPAEMGYDPEAKWLSAQARVGTKQREEPAARVSDLEAMFGPAEGVPAGPTAGGDATAQGASAAVHDRGRVIGPFSLSDLGNAERLIAWYGNMVRYEPNAGAWLVYNGAAWDDVTGEALIEARVKDALNLAAANEWTLYSDVAHDPEAKNHKSDLTEFWKWMGGSQSYSRVAATTKMARSDERLHASMADFDADPMVFNARNCVVNLETGQTAPHAPELLFRHRGGVDYVPDAVCPMWERFLEEVQPDPEVRSWLQQVLGYSMTGRMDEHAMFLHAGPGATGKTTFLEVVMAVLGDYGQKLDRDTLISKGNNAAQIPADLARMAGARFLAASETAAGKKLDDERIKELVGGDKITARRLHENWFEFRPTGKIHMATNHLPSFESGGDGMGRRLRLVPWEVQIPEHRRDKTLKERIIATEAQGVLAWLVRGAVAWANGTGLVTPESVARRSREHVEEADPLWPFISERLETGPDFETEFTAVLGSYESWCQMNGNRPMSGRAFSMGLRERLGGDSKFNHPDTRRSMFRVRVKMMAVPDYHQQYATPGT